MKRELLKKMASVANILDANGLEAEANTITNLMVKIAAEDTNTEIPPRTNPMMQDKKTFITKDRPGYDKNYEKDFQRILENYERMPYNNRLYYFLKGFASEYYKGIDPAKFANNFLSWLKKEDRQFTKSQVGDRDLYFFN
jgi:hypothetical protein